MIATFAIVSGCLGIRLRTYCRIRHRHKCDSIYNLRLRKFAPCKGEIHRVQISGLCDGCISLSYAEGLWEKSSSCHLFPHTTFSLSIFTGACHAPVIHTERKNLPSETPVHFHLFQILLPCIFSFFLGWSSLIFCI